MLSMLTTNRRTFMLQAAACGALIGSTQAMAQAAKLDEKDAQAIALAYTADTTKVDAKKHAKHEASQKCNNCALYQGKATDAWGGCPLFPGKQVAGPGWCSAWAKKA